MISRIWASLHLRLQNLLTRRNDRSVGEPAAQLEQSDS
jgi:hypothetical protein